MARKRFRKICVICGKVFFTTSEKKETCKKECKKILIERRRKEKCKEQLCWECAKCTGGCSWSRSLTPVAGWKANEVHKKESDGYILRTYKIISCPQFVRG